MSMPAQLLTRWARQIVALKTFTFFLKSHPGCKHVMCFRPSVRVSILKNDRRYTFTGFLLEDDWRRDNCLSGWAGCFVGRAGCFLEGGGSSRFLHADLNNFIFAFRVYHKFFIFRVWLGWEATVSTITVIREGAGFLRCFNHDDSVFVVMDGWSLAWIVSKRKLKLIKWIPACRLHADNRSSRNSILRCFHTIRWNRTNPSYPSCQSIGLLCDLV